MAKKEQGKIDPQVNLRIVLSGELHRLFKANCALKGLSMNQVIVSLVRHWIVESEGELKGLIDDNN
jgi:hypothetical protein